MGIKGRKELDSKNATSIGRSLGNDAGDAPGAKCGLARRQPARQVQPAAAKPELAQP